MNVLERKRGITLIGLVVTIITILILAGVSINSIIGKNAIVTKDIDSINGKGQIKVDSETWSALGKDDMNIEKGTEVEVLKIDGVKAIVTPVKK